jgi:hypothetical protein
MTLFFFVKDLLTKKDRPEGCHGNASLAFQRQRNGSMHVEQALRQLSVLVTIDPSYQSMRLRLRNSNVLEC